MTSATTIENLSESNDSFFNDDPTYSQYNTGDFNRSSYNNFN
jgi:hypothetical protein